MRAVAVTRFGGPEQLHLIDVPSELLGPGQVRLRVRAAGVNPTDTQYRAGAYAHLTPDEPAPWIPGMDVAGHVIQIGSAVAHLSVGDLAMGVVIPQGGYREDIVLPSMSVVRAPKGVDAVAASTLPMNGLTARLALNRMGLRPGQVLAVTGAAGAFGGYVVQLAKVGGLTVIADAADTDHDLVQALGADIIVGRGDQVADSIRARFPDGVDGLADGSLQGPLVLPAVKDGGVMTTVRGYDAGHQDRVRVIPVLVSEIAHDTRSLDELRLLAEAGAITFRVARTFDARQAAEAHRLLERGGVRGRFVLTF